MWGFGSRVLRLDLAGRAWVAKENDEKAYFSRRERDLGGGGFRAR